MWEFYTILSGVMWGNEIGISMRWVLKLTCEWNASPGFRSGRMKLKCKIPPVEG